MTTKRDILQNLATQHSTAWSSGDSTAIGDFYAEDGQIAINRGDVLAGRQAIIDMAAEFHAEFPDLKIRCYLMCAAGSHCIFVWTLEEHHAETKNHVVVGGWEEWELNSDMKVQNRLAGLMPRAYQRQIDGA